MLISRKAHAANLQNAQHSCGPISDEGKEAIRCNALKFGLRTRRTIIPGESEVRYFKLWDEYEAEYQPQTPTERAYLESMVTSQWLLRRMAASERSISKVYADNPEQQLKLLAYVYKFRAQLQREFRNAVEDMRKSVLSRERRERYSPGRAREQAVPPPPVVAPPEPNPTWLMAPPPVEQTIALCGLPSSQPDTR